MKLLDRELTRIKGLRGFTGANVDAFVLYKINSNNLSLLTWFESASYPQEMLLKLLDRHPRHEARTDLQRIFVDVEGWCMDV